MAAVPNHGASSGVAGKPAADLSYGESRFKDAFREQDKALFKFINTKDLALSESLQKLGVLKINDAGSITIVELGRTLTEYLNDNEISVALKELKAVQLNMAKEDDIMARGGLSAVAARVRWFSLASQENTAKEKLAELSKKFGFEINPAEIEKEGVPYLQSAFRLKINLDRTREVRLKQETALKPRAYAPPHIPGSAEEEAADATKAKLAKTAISNLCTIIREMPDTEKSSKEFVQMLLVSLQDVDAVKESGFSTKVLENYDRIACRHEKITPNTKTFLGDPNSFVSKRVLAGAVRATLAKQKLPVPRDTSGDKTADGALRAFKVAHEKITSIPYRTAYLALLDHMESIKEAAKASALLQDQAVKTLYLLRAIDATVDAPYSAHVLALYDRSNKNSFSSRDFEMEGNDTIPFNLDLLVQSMQIVEKHSFIQADGKTRMQQARS